jgi:hypothetical protein
MIDHLRLVFLAFVILHALEAFGHAAKARGARRRTDGKETLRARAALAIMIWIFIQLSPALYYSAELVKFLMPAA